MSIFYRAGLDINWNEYHRDFDRFQDVLTLPGYQWDYKTHWIQYVNDWCLTKGSLPSSSTAAAADVPAATQPRPTTTCQRVIQQEKGDETSSVTIETDISDPELRNVFESHKVNGAMLCPSSVYADIALTIGEYLDNPVPQRSGTEVANMVVSKPLIMRTPGQPELFRTSAVANWTAQTAEVSYYSVGQDGKKTIEHATCLLRFGDPKLWSDEWERFGYLVQSRIQILEHAVQSGRCHRIKRGMVYKLFENCVDYGNKFRGIDEVVLDSQEHEATARVVFQDRNSNFLGNPYYIDSLGHLSGFVMNATETCDYKTNVFINHGWNSMRCAVRLSPDETYQTYVKMQSSDGSRYSGDVYIFQAGRIVGVNQGITFRAVSRKVLDALLPNRTSASSSRVATRPIPPANPSQTAQRRKALAMTNTNNSRQMKMASAPTRNAQKCAPMVQALNIVAEEIGISVSELKEDVEFADMGVDSLLSLTISGRFREELEMEIDSAFFIDHPTVKDMEDFLQGEPSSTSDTSSTERESSDEHNAVSSDDTDYDADLGSHSSIEQRSISDDVCSIIAEEIGVAMDDVWNARDLAELGLDSLMSLTVLGRLRDELDIDLPADIFFGSNMDAISRHLGYHGPTEIGSKKDTSVSRAPPVLTSDTQMPPASSIVLQGNPKTAIKTLFLLPDGSGSATSYAALPRVGANIAIVGLNCPFMKTPRDLNCALQDVTAPYLAEIQRRQPRGPYYLGGWSAGGISAFDAARVLISNGEQVSGLVLLDSPNPIGLSKLPRRMYDFLDSLNIFGTGNAPPPGWLLPHFLAFIDALALYEPKPLPPGKTPPTHVLWAADGVYRSSGGKHLDEQPEDPKEMRWLLHDRTDFGPNGWDQLLDKDSLQIDVLQGANHFTMMERNKSSKLSLFLARAMGLRR